MVMFKSIHILSQVHSNGCLNKWDPVFGSLEDVHKIGLTALGRRFVHVFPACRQRQSHQNGFDAGSRRAQTKPTANMLGFIKNLKKVIIGNTHLVPLSCTRLNLREKRY